MDTCARIRSGRRDAFPLTILGVATLGLAPTAAPRAIAQEREAEAVEWVVPRTPAGHPDLQGNWSNATVTPHPAARGARSDAHLGSGGPN